MRKNVSCICFLLVTLTVLLCTTSCGNVESAQKQIDITPENYDEFFFISIDDTFDQWTSALGSLMFRHDLLVKCRSTMTASYYNVVLKGYIQLPVDQDEHLLYKEGKMPCEVTLKVDGTGYGECKAEISHGTGSYGGFSVEDFYFECVSASGYIKYE